MPVRFGHQESSEVTTDSDGNSKTKRPKDTPARQQRVPAWQPIYTVGTVVPTFFLIGVAFIPIGIGMLSFSNKVMETIIPYTDCKNKEGEFCKNVIKNINAIDRDCFCNITFEIDTDWTGDVFIFYALTNFFQNHRRYLRSRNDYQLLGKLNVEEWGNLDNCDPYQYCEDSSSCCNGATGEGACSHILPNKTVYFPCGAIANSLFSDIISLK